MFTLDQTWYSQRIWDIHITKLISSASYIMGQLSISISTLFDKKPQKVGRCLCWLSEFEGLVLH